MTSQFFIIIIWFDSKSSALLPTYNLFWSGQPTLFQPIQTRKGKFKLINFIPKKQMNLHSLKGKFYRGSPALSPTIGGLILGISIGYKMKTTIVIIDLILLDISQLKKKSKEEKKKV